MDTLAIELKTEGTDLRIILKGRLDTNTAPMLESELKNELDNKKNVIVEAADLEYISSAGLRVLLAIKKTIGKEGELYIDQVTEDVRDIFDVTGFSDILKIR